jgi:tetratricopeptide (TPR) repeat protein
MLATKKQGRASRVLSLTAAGALLFISCTPPGPRALLKGERLIGEGKYEAAITKLEEATRLLPREAQAWNHLGLAYHGARRFADAIRAYQQALALDHNLAAAQYNLGSLHLERADLNAAITTLTTFTGLQPQSDFGWLKLGTACLRAGQLDAAERSFNRALQINNRPPAALNGLGLVRMQRRHYAEAYRQFEAALRVQADHAPALLNSAIVAHQFLNDRASALQKYQRYLALKPQPANWEAVDRIARQLDAELHPATRPPGAGTTAQLAAAPTPVEAEGASAKREPKADARAPTLKPAPAAPAATTPNRPGPAGTESTASSPEPTRPKTVAAEATKEDPATPTRELDATQRVPPQSKANAVSAPAASGGKESSTAPEPAGSTPKASPPVVGSAPLAVPRSTVLRYRYQSPSVPKAGDRTLAEQSVAEGLRLQERYQVKEAIEKYREAIRADPSSFDAHYNLGVAAFDAGDLPQTLTAYEYALAVDATARKARFNFAIALERAGYPRDAAQELERLVADHPTETRAQFNLAHLYADKLSEPQRAKTAYLRVLELNPQHPQATAIRYWLEANP